MLAGRHLSSGFKCLRGCGETHIASQALEFPCVFLERHTSSVTLENSKTRENTLGVFFRNRCMSRRKGRRGRCGARPALQCLNDRRVKTAFFGAAVQTHHISRRRLGRAAAQRVFCRQNNPISNYVRVNSRSGAVGTRRAHDQDSAWTDEWKPGVWNARGGMIVVKSMARGMRVVSPYSGRDYVLLFT